MIIMHCKYLNECIKGLNIQYCVWAHLLKQWICCACSAFRFSKNPTCARHLVIPPSTKEKEEKTFIGIVMVLVLRLSSTLLLRILNGLAIDYRSMKTGFEFLRNPLEWIWQHNNRHTHAETHTHTHTQALNSLDNFWNKSKSQTINTNRETFNITAKPSAQS